MVAIKEMNIPNRCAKCKFCLRQGTNNHGTFGKCLLQKNKRVNCLVWNRDDNCPLVEVVTCKDCKYNDKNVCTVDGYGITDDYFCASAMKKDDERRLDYADQDTIMSAT